MQKTELLDDFIFDCQSRSRVKRTIETYRGNVREFLEFFPEPENVDNHDLRAFLAHLQKRGLKISTLKGYFSALSTFYDYLIFEKMAETNPILPFRRRYLDKPTKNDRRQLLNVKSMKQLIGSIEPIREQAMLLTLAKHGVRRDEYLCLKDENIDLRRNEIIYPQKAKRNNRVLPIDNELHEVLVEYRTWRKKHATSDWFWVTTFGGGKIHKDYTNEVISYYAEPLGLHEPNGPLNKRLTCHCFRKWFTHHLYAAGMDETSIMILRGDSLKGKAWSGSYLEPNELTEQIKEEYFKCVPKLL
jgi:site-specific recombinase XerD